MENIDSFQEINMSAIKPVFPLWAKGKINALKNLQIKITNVETQFFDEIQNLENKYMKMFNPLYDERKKIITGEKAKLSEEETTWNYEDGNEYENLEDAPQTAQNNLPDFWLEAFRSSKLLSSLVQEHDEPVFEHLIDIRCRLHDQKPYGYTIEFHFSENEYFTNTVLTKTYELICEKDETRPFLLAKGNFYKCLGCTIDWKKGKDLTVKLVKSKEEDKKSNVNRIVTKEEEQDTFFTFFSTPTEDGIKPSVKALLKNEKSENKQLNEDNDPSTEDLNHNLDTIYELYFEIGQYLKDTFLPKAVLYYTGELNEFNDEDFGDDDLDDYDDDEDSDNDEEDDDDDNANHNDQDDEEQHQQKQTGPRKKSKPQ